MKGTFVIKALEHIDTKITPHNETLYCSHIVHDFFFRPFVETTATPTPKHQFAQCRPQQQHQQTTARTWEDGRTRVSLMRLIIFLIIFFIFPRPTSPWASCRMAFKTFKSCRINKSKRHGTKGPNKKKATEDGDEGTAVTGGRDGGCGGGRGAAKGW